MADQPDKPETFDSKAKRLLGWRRRETTPNEQWVIDNLPRGPLTMHLAQLRELFLAYGTERMSADGQALFERSLEEIARYTAAPMTPDFPRKKGEW